MSKADALDPPPGLHMAAITTLEQQMGGSGTSDAMGLEGGHIDATGLHLLQGELGDALCPQTQSWVLGKPNEELGRMQKVGINVLRDRH